MCGSVTEAFGGSDVTLRSRAAFLVLAGALSGAPGCARNTEAGGDQSGSAPIRQASAGEVPKHKEKTAMLNVRSSAFEANGSIPKKYTCEGQDIAPPLEWSGAPAGTQSFALIVDDPDAPDPAAPKRTWVHWVLFDIPASVTSLAEGGAPPSGARVGVNDFKRAGYGGPCPPIGRHRYYHKIYALDVMLGLDKPSKAELERAMQGHVLASGELIGTYAKGK